MKKNDGIMMPDHYMVIGENEIQQIEGGAVTTWSLLNFISYMLSGLSVSFGSGNNHVNTDTVAVASQASTSASSGRGGVMTTVASTAAHSNVDTVSRGEYFNWGANFNLGGIFSALVRLFM